MEQVQVPQQNEGGSCRYRMLSNLSEVIKGQRIQEERKKERNRLYYYLEIAQTLKDNQIKSKQWREEKRKRREEEEEGKEEQEEIEEEQKQRRKRNRRDNAENKKRNSISQGNKEQGEEDEEEGQKKRKEQRRQGEDRKLQRQEIREQYTYSPRSGRFRVEDMQPD